MQYNYYLSYARGGSLVYLCCFINKMEYKWDGLMNDDGADNRIIEGGGMILQSTTMDGRWENLPTYVGKSTFFTRGSSNPK